MPGNDDVQGAPDCAAKSIWRLPPATLSLGNEEVHVWRLALDLPTPSAGTLIELLDPDERERASRFRFQPDRTRFVVAHALLRLILGRYLDLEPWGLCFGRGPQGKPHLLGPGGREALCFNLTHSAGLALLAVARSREVGVDLEKIRSDFDTRRLAEQLFSPREVAILQNLPQGEQLAAFFRAWTQKEAYLKARGAGLEVALDHVEVSLAAGDARLLRVSGDAVEASRWEVRLIEPGPGFVAALAVQACSASPLMHYGSRIESLAAGDRGEPRLHIRCWQWNAGWPASSGQTSHRAQQPRRAIYDGR